MHRYPSQESPDHPCSTSSDATLIATVAGLPRLLQVVARSRIRRPGDPVAQQERRPLQELPQACLALQLRRGHAGVVLTVGRRAGETRAEHHRRLLAGLLARLRADLRQVTREEKAPWAGRDAVEGHNRNLQRHESRPSAMREATCRREGTCLEGASREVDRGMAYGGDCRLPQSARSAPVHGSRCVSA